MKLKGALWDSSWRDIMRLVSVGQNETCLSGALWDLSWCPSARHVTWLGRALFHLSWQGVFCLLQGVLWFHLLWHFIAGLGFVAFLGIMSLFLALYHLSRHNDTCLSIVTCLANMSLVSALCHLEVCHWSQPGVMSLVSVKHCLGGGYIIHL